MTGIPQGRLLLATFAVAGFVLAGCLSDEPSNEPLLDGPSDPAAIHLGNATNGSFLYATDASGPVGIELAFEVIGEQSCFFVEGWHAESSPEGVYFRSELLDQWGSFRSGMSFSSSPVASVSINPVIETKDDGSDFGARSVPAERTFSGAYTYIGLLPDGGSSDFLFGASFYVGLTCDGPVVVTKIAPASSGIGWTSSEIANGTGVGTLGPFVRLMGSLEVELDGTRVVGRAWPGGFIVGPIIDELTLEGPGGPRTYDMTLSGSRDLAGDPGRWSVETSAVNLAPLGGGHRAILMGVTDVDEVPTHLDIPAELRQA